MSCGSGLCVCTACACYVTSFYAMLPTMLLPRKPEYSACTYNVPYICRYVGSREWGIIISWLVIFKVALDKALACCYLWGDGQMAAGSDQGSAAKGSAKDLEAPVSMVGLAVVYPLPPLSFPFASIAWYADHLQGNNMFLCLAG